MKHPIIPVLVIVMLSCSSLAVSQSRQGDLLVEITKVPSTKGNISIALCSDQEQYYSDENIFRAVRIEPERPRTVYVFKDLPYGRYALKIYHDKNGNHKLDTGFFGMPKERYGFSNDPKVRMSMPSYEECVFEVDSEHQKQFIKLR